MAHVFIFCIDKCSNLCCALFIIRSGCYISRLLIFKFYAHVFVIAERGNESYSSEAEKIIGREGITISSTTNGSRPSNSTFDGDACDGADSDY